MSITRTPRRRRIGAVSIVIGATLMAIGFMASPAQAGGNPTFVDDNNPKCNMAAVGSFPSEAKIDTQPSDGDSTWDTSEMELVGTVPSSLVIAIDNLTQGGGTVTFDWSATVADGDDAGSDRDPFLIDRVLVKAGTGANMWTYAPPASSGTGQYSPKDSISHINFCWGPHETTTDGTTDDPTTDDGTTDDPTTDDGTTDDATTDDSTTTDDVQATAGSQDTAGTDATDTLVAGEVVLPETLPATGAEDRSLLILGIGFIAIGAVVLVTKRAVFIR